MLLLVIIGFCCVFETFIGGDDVKAALLNRKLLVFERFDDEVVCEIVDVNDEILMKILLVVLIRVRNHR